MEQSRPLLRSMFALFRSSTSLQRTHISLWK